VVRDLGDAKRPWESPVIEPPSKEFEFDVEEGVQPPRHIMAKDFEEVDQEIEIKEEEAQPPMPLVSNEEDIGLEESYQEEEVETEEACKEVEVIKGEHQGMELEITFPKLLETSPPKPFPSNTTFKWVKFISLSFIIPLEYGLLETDGQLRALCGFKSKREMVSGWQHNPRFVVVGSSKSKCKGWCRARMNGSRKLFGCLSENSDCLPPRWNHHVPLADGCRNKIWDPGIHEDRLWELKACEELHQSLRNLPAIDIAYWKSKHWWKFQDEFKHKPP